MAGLSRRFAMSAPSSAYLFTFGSFSALLLRMLQSL